MSLVKIRDTVSPDLLRKSRAMGLAALRSGVSEEKQKAES